MAAGKCKAAYHTDEYHGFECSITESPYKFPHQDNKFYPEQYEEGPDAVEIDFEEINIEEIEESLNELEQYKKLGTLEEVRDAVEKQKYCNHCGYKIHSNNISKLNSCNNCGLKSTCKKRPDYGEYCRINCYDWSEEK